MSSKTCIKFNAIHDSPFGSLSPLSPHPVVVRHQYFSSLNHFFQTRRFSGTSSEESLSAAKTLWELERLTKKAEDALHQAADWDTLKPDVMLLGNYLKFKQNSDASVVLLQTGMKLLVYHNADSYWGDGLDGSGRNMLGAILMAVRKRLVSDEKTKRNR
eukprot:Tbor_TRINITY_DN5274_c0_g2::TRINITY_DN5274_c0_g2_i1::g.16053::m.16053/K09935/K09935; uncharacterized protein